MIDVYMTHYVTDALVGYNDLVVDAVYSLLDGSAGLRPEEWRLLVLYWTDSEACEKDLGARIPPNALLVRHDSGVQPSLMNRATALAKESGAQHFVCIHNDVRPARGWLRNLVGDVRAAEQRYGRGRVVASPRYVPYHWVEPHKSAYVHAELWDRLRPEREAKVLSTAAMADWCRRTGFGFEGQHVVCPSPSYATDDGHQLMMYCAAPEAFDDIGGCDETFAGLNYGDCDWGIRLLMAGKKNLISQGALLGHVSGVTFYNPTVFANRESNHERFIAKWGEAIFAEMQTGEIWRRLHREQKERGL